MLGDETKIAFFASRQQLNTHFKSRMGTLVLQLFWPFCQVVQKYADEIEPHLDSDVPISLKWFIKTFKTNKTNESRFLYIRFLIFWSLELLQKKLDLFPEHPNYESTQQLLNGCFDLQPLNDRLHSCMIDITDWLIVYDQVLDPNLFYEPDTIQKFHRAWEVSFSN